MNAARPFDLAARMKESANVYRVDCSQERDTPVRTEPTTSPSRKRPWKLVSVHGGGISGVVVASYATQEAAERQMRIHLDALDKARIYPRPEYRVVKV